MSRIKRGINARKKRRKILKLAKGFFGARSRLLRTATEAVNKAMKYAFRDRRARKREISPTLDCAHQCSCQYQQYILQPLNLQYEENGH